MKPLDRRQFIGATAGVAATLAATQELRAEDAVPAPPLVPLGKTGISVSRLAQGTGVHGGNRQSDQTRMGFEKLVDLFQHSFDRGIRFFDLADLYGTHVYFREALRTVPREEVAILTKIWWPYDGPRNETNSPERTEDVQATLERFCHELTTDYIDVVLLHCLTNKDWNRNMQPYMDVLSEAKEKKQVRAVGVSCHDFGAMETAASEPWVDVILARINPKGVAMDGTPEQVIGVLKKAKDNGKAIIGMKIFGEGKLVNERDACMKFAQGLGLLDAMTIGFENADQIDDALRLMDKYPAKAV
jgi:aryl-alcohol dehydrogenase-like predicted oxidoreductase